MKKKFAVYPGNVKSKNDGDWHYINAPTLMRLYQVDPKECVVMRQGRLIHIEDVGNIEAEMLGLIHLRPLYSGDYDGWVERHEREVRAIMLGMLIDIVEAGIIVPPGVFLQLMPHLPKKVRSMLAKQISKRMPEEI